jgi:hypothetical protein
MVKGKNASEANGAWKGDKVGLNALHQWVKRRLKKPERCESCRRISRLDLANSNGKYLRNLTDWNWLCRKCHMESDGRLNNLCQNSHIRHKHPCEVCGAYTIRIRFCKPCAEIRRREWWKIYNKTKKRKEYLANWYHQNYLRV